MGCSENKDSNIPVLLCFFESGNEAQKQYCIRLKDNFKHERTIRFEIKSTPQIPFSIRFRVNGNTVDVQNVFDDSEERMNETLNRMYSMLNNLK